MGAASGMPPRATTEVTADYRPTPRARAFARQVLASLDDQAVELEAIEARPEFRVEVWPDLGEMPVAVPRRRRLGSRLAVSASELGHAQLGRRPRNDLRWASISEAIRQAQSIYGAALPELTLPRPADISDARTFEQVVVGGFHELGREDDGSRSLDLQFLRDYPVRDGFLPLGGKIFVSTLTRAPTRLITPEGEEHEPADPSWALETMRFRASLYNYLSFVPHAVWCHGVVGPKLFLATAQLPDEHPLRTLLRPFVHDVHRGVSRAKTSLFGPVGALAHGSPFTASSVQLLVTRARSWMRVQCVPELDLEPELGALLRPIWRALDECARGFIVAFAIDEADPVVAAWRRYLALHVSSGLATLSLSELITYLVFTSTVSHHLWGHRYFGTCDPTAVPAAIYRSWRGSSLLDRSEPGDMTLTRLGTIVSIRRGFVSIARDFGATTREPRAKPIFARLAAELGQVLAMPNELWLDRVASSAVL